MHTHFILRLSLLHRSYFLVVRLMQCIKLDNANSCNRKIILIPKVGVLTCDKYAEQQRLGYHMLTTNASDAEELHI